MTPQSFASLNSARASLNMSQASNRNRASNNKGRPMSPRPVPAAAKSGERIAKVIARAGLASRREAEQWIADGRVAVNGEVIASPALNVAPSDKIIVDGKPL